MIEVTPINTAALLPGCTRVAARIRYGAFRREQLWFDVPESEAKSGASPGDGWLLALLPLAFDLGRPLRIEAPVDPLLLANAGKLQRLWTEWFPGRQPVPVTAPVAESRGVSGNGRTGLFFSGGVDSFFSLLHFDAAARSAPENGARKIDELIFVWGFDIPLTNRAAFERKANTISKIAARFGKRAVIAATNIRQTRLEKLHWGTRLHGAAMGASAVLSGRRFNTVLISASRVERDLTPWGSNGSVVPLMSTSATRFVCYGGEFNRFEKSDEVARSDIALEHLHVCWKDESDRNCGRCQKCMRALVTFELLGKRNRAASFPPAGFSLDHVRALQMKNALMVGLWMELRDAAVRFSRADVLEAIDACMAANAIRI